MDPCEKITADLEPLGGELFIDRFIQARRTALAQRRAAMRKLETPPAPPENAPTANAPHEEQAAPHNRVLQDEVKDFMRRGEREETDSDEIKEFMREKRGFDPGSLE